MAVKLTRPTLEMKDACLDFAKDWEQSGENITPYSARLLGQSYEEWLEACIRMETAAPANFVTAHTFFLTDEFGVILGAINIRHYLNDYLLSYGGHIGYGIRPSARNKGYAKQMLALALPVARGLGIKDALITCDKDNTASARTILSNGGVLENEVEENGRITQRYWIKL